jgi:hypothetical protein
MTMEVSFDIAACDSATQFYRQQKVEKERFDAEEQENEEFRRRIKNLEKPYKPSKLNVDYDIAKYSIWSEKCLTNGLFELDTDHSTCKKCCKHGSAIVKRGYRRKKERKEIT